MDIKWFLFSFNGRINRQPFWLFTISAGLIWLILSILLGIDIMSREKDPRSVIPLIILLWPSLAVQAKRWHDRDRSAWWILIGIIPLVGPLWSLIETGIRAGTNGPNRFGEDPLGRASHDRTGGAAVPDEELSDIEWKPGKYYLSSFMRTMLMIGCALLVASSLLSYVLLSRTSLGIPGGIIPVLIMDILIVAVMIWRFRTPLIELSEDRIRVGIPFIFKTNSARWEEIEAMVVGEMSTLGFREQNIKLMLRSGRAATKEMLVSLMAVEKPEEIIERVRIRVPEKKYEDIKKAPILRQAPAVNVVRYRNFTLDQGGLVRGKENIPWSSIREIKYAGLVIAGYGAATISYVAGGGVKKTITVQPSVRKEYLDFIRYLIRNAENAAIDPGLLKALEYPLSDASADQASILLFLAGILLSIISGTFIFWYSNGIASGYLNALIIVPLGLLPLLMTLISIAGRFRGKNERSGKKVLWSSMAAIGPIIALPVFFAVSPFSYFWVAGDVFVKTGDIERAERCYQSALERLPDSIDVLYEMGKLSRGKKEYEKAFDYLKRAYTQDPTYWGPKAVALIPDTLMQIGRYDEALQWCERIKKDLHGKVDIARAIDEKRKEIMSKKGREGNEE